MLRNFVQGTLPHSFNSGAHFGCSFLATSTARGSAELLPMICSRTLKISRPSSACRFGL